MLTKLECITLLNGHDTTLEVEAFKEVWQHLHSLGATYELQSRIGLQHLCNERSVVGLHVVSHQIVGLATIEGCLQVCLPLLALATVGSIQHRNLLIVDEIGIITHALRHHILTFKQVDVKIINTDVLNGFTNHIHCSYLFFSFSTILASHSCFF